MHRFDETAERAARVCLDYALERLQLDPVPLDGPVPVAELRAAAGTTITAEGRSPEDVMAVFCDVLAPACVSTDSPRHLAFIPAAPTKTALLFDMVVAASSICATSWLEAAGAVYAENEALDVLARLAGLPDGAGGCFVSGGSAGNLSALFAARERAARRAGTPRSRWRVAVGAEAHSSVTSTLRILDCDALVVASDPRGRLTGDALERALADDGDPESVVAVVTTAGTTNSGVVDDLAGVTAVARDHDLWCHVDAAYGGAALFAPSVRHRFDGVEASDSIVIDPHKWLFAPFDSCALLYRDPAAARAAHAQRASYLDPMRADEEAGAWNPADYAYHLSRRARGLPLWFSLAVHGTDAYRDSVEQVLAITAAAARAVETAPHVELVQQPELSVLLFRRPGWTDADYARWARDLLHRQVAFVLPTQHRGETVGRAAFLHPLTTAETFDEILAAMV